MVDDVLASTLSVQQRVRGLPSRVVVYLLLSTGPRRDRLPARLGTTDRRTRRAAPAQPVSSALAQARRRVGAKALRALFELLAGPADGATRWRGWLICAIDGMTLSVPDSATNLTCYRRQRGSHGGSGYPLLRLLTVVACGTRTVNDAVFGPTSVGETNYAPGGFRFLRPRMLLLVDRNVAAQTLTTEIDAAGADLLIRCKDNRLLPRIGEVRLRVVDAEIVVTGTGARNGTRRVCRYKLITTSPTTQRSPPPTSSSFTTSGGRSKPFTLN